MLRPAAFLFFLCISCIGAASTAEDVYAKTSPSVVMILTDSGTGSGVIVAKNKVVTNYHVAGSARQILVKYRSITYPATAGPAKPEWDVMLLDVPNLDAPSVAIKASGSLKVGQTAFALGAPKGLELSLSTGIVSALRFDNGYNIVQTSAPFSPGSSGGGLFDEKGNLIGITTLKGVGHGVEGIGFAMPADLVHELLNPGSRPSGGPSAFYLGGALLFIIVFGIASIKYVRSYLERAMEPATTVEFSASDERTESSERRAPTRPDFKVSEATFLAMAKREVELGNYDSDTIAHARSFANGADEQVPNLYLRFRVNALLDAEKELLRRSASAPASINANISLTPKNTSASDSAIRLELFLKRSAAVLGATLLGLVVMSYVRAMA
jgi:hypothetical protein